ncbi:Oxysterol-binding protein-like protein, partial [Lachnellula subtilissima]
SATPGNRSSIDDSRSDGPEDDTTVVEPDQGNVLSHIISQLRPGADLSRVVLPTFILEPRSMLERITNFMAHPEMLLPIPELDDPVQRFVSVVKFYLSGWHIKPPGVKKPLNPILGETFTGYWDFPDGTRGYYISEQTSHHPPKSSYFYMAPEHHIRIDGTLKPRSKFLGNSAASMMEGIAFLSFLNRGKGPKGERYIISQPNMYARGILFGKMKYELGDHSFVRCPELGLSADVEFKTKGYFGGTYNAIGGTIKNEKTGEVLYELSGMWTNEMWIKDVKLDRLARKNYYSMLREQSTRHRPHDQLRSKTTANLKKLWLNTAQAVKERNHVVATDEKTKIEDMQRDEAAKRAEEGVEWVPRLFRPVQGGPGGIDEGEEDLDWILNANIDGATPEKQVEQILAVTPILRGQKFNEKNPIPKRNPSIISTNTPAKAAPAPALAAPAPAPTGESDLIDFGQNETSAIPADLKAAQTENGGQQQKELESVLSNTSTSHADGKGKGPLLDFQDMTAALPAKQTLLREDTDTHSVDEFHDAKA